MNNYLSYTEADELCDEMIRQFIDDSEKLHAVDIDAFVTDYLKCTVRYECISEKDPTKIGFTADGKRPLKVLRSGTVKVVTFPKNTIILDQYLLQAEEESRRRFILGHEAGHILSSRLNLSDAAGFHSSFDNEHVYTLDELKDQCSINEWQANTFAAALLMPRFMMLKALEKYNKGKPITVYGESVFAAREKRLLNKIATLFNVSYTALVIRLRKLKMLDYRDLSEYVEKHVAPAE